MVKVGSLPFETAVRVTNPGAVSPRYGVRLGVTTVGDIEEGDALLVSLFVRGAMPGGDPGEPVSIAARLQQNGGEVNGGAFGRIVEMEVNTAADLDDPAGRVQFVQPAPAPLTQPGGTHSFSIHLGAKAQTVELGGFWIVNHGPDRDPETLPVTRVTYPGTPPGGRPPRTASTASARPT